MPPNGECTSTSTFLLAISNASAARRQRHQEGTQNPLLKNDNQGEEVISKTAAQLRPFESSLSLSSSSSEEEEEEQEQDRQTRSKIAHLHRQSLQEWHTKRYKASLTNTLSRTQLDDAVVLLTQTPSSSEKTLSDEILALWNANQARIRASLPRYVEGYPVRDRIQPPRFGARRSLKPSGLGDCLQCLAKGLPCSMGVRATGGEGEEGLRGGCRRCVADGERCIIEHEEVHEGNVDVDADGDAEEEDKGHGMTGDGKGREEEEESGLWDWWDGVPDREQDVDSAAEAIEMWERRRKGMKLELIGGRMLWVEFRGFAPRGMTETSL